MEITYTTGGFEIVLMGLYQLGRTKTQQLLDMYVYERRVWSGWEEMRRK